MNEQPILAICYDFDKTLSPDDMQAQERIHSECMTEKRDETRNQTEEDLIREEMIDELEESMNFQKTHEMIKKLGGIRNWTEPQRKKLLRIALENKQVTYIL